MNNYSDVPQDINKLSDIEGELALNIYKNIMPIESAELYSRCQAIKKLLVALVKNGEDGFYPSNKKYEMDLFNMLDAFFKVYYLYQKEISNFK